MKLFPLATLFTCRRLGPRVAGRQAAAAGRRQEAPGRRLPRAVCPPGLQEATDGRRAPAARRGAGQERHRRPQRDEPRAGVRRGEPVGWVTELTRRSKFLLRRVFKDYSNQHSDLCRHENWFSR